MALQTYSGSCHCGSVRYQADIDFDAGTNRCNCSNCFKVRAWFAFARGPERFRVTSGQDSITEYRWTPPHMPAPHLTFRFCKHCGIRTFAGGNLEQLGGVFHAVAVTTLDVDPDVLAAAPLNYVDGKHNRFDRAPDDTRLL
jgi:hypothetical protein